MSNITEIEKGEKFSIREASEVLGIPYPKLLRWAKMGRTPPVAEKTANGVYLVDSEWIENVGNQKLSLLATSELMGIPYQGLLRLIKLGKIESPAKIGRLFLTDSAWREKLQSIIDNDLSLLEEYVKDQPSKLELFIAALIFESSGGMTKKEIREACPSEIPSKRITEAVVRMINDGLLTIDYVVGTRRMGYTIEWHIRLKTYPLENIVPYQQNVIMALQGKKGVPKPWSEGTGLTPWGERA